MIVRNNNEPSYIEDFRSEQPDWANGNDRGGDPGPDTDWLPAFKRAAFCHLTMVANDPLAFQHTYQRTGFDLPQPIKDYGGECTLSNLLISSTGDARAEVSRGVIIQRASRLEKIDVSGFGWHGFHVTADVHRTVDNIEVPFRTRTVRHFSTAVHTIVLTSQARTAEPPVSPIQMDIALSAAALGWKEAMPISAIREVSAARSVPGGRSMTSDSWAIGTTCLSARTVTTM
jgi:hypothetical protein